MKNARNLRTKSEPAVKPAADKNRSRSYLIGAAILAVFVVHFAWQFSFVQRENWRMAEDSMNVAPPEMIAVESLPSETPPTDLTAQRANVEEPKTVLPAKFSPSENKRPQPPEPKKKTPPVESKSERLRRAEKLLTGF